MSYQEFIEIFAQKVSSIFKHQKINNYIIYVHKFVVNNKREIIVFRWDNDTEATNIQILELWVSHCADIFNKPPIDILLKNIYETISIEDLDLYIKMTCHISTYLPGDNVTSKLIELYKRTNLELYEFIDEFFSYVCIFFSKWGFWWHIFEARIYKMNNDKISPLWEDWLDYSDNHYSYIEWLPKEILEDLIMIQNGGKYQPGYDSYLK